MHNDMNWQMIVTLYEDENFTKRAIKKQHWKKWFAD